MNKGIFWRAPFCVLGCWVLYLFFSFPSWREPIMGDEVVVVMWIKSLKDNAITEFFIKNIDALFGRWHPPTYIRMASFLGNVFTLNETTIRIIGIASFLMSLILIYMIACGIFRQDTRKENIAALACLIYALNPLAVKGSLLIDIDGTILNVAVLALIAAFIWFRYDEKPLRAFFIHTILFAAALCVKIATPFILMASIIAYQLLRRETQKLAYTLKVAASGIFLAFFIWGVYCWFNQWNVLDILEVPKSVIKSFFLKSSRKEEWLLMARNIWTPIIWCSPSFVIMAVIAFWKALKVRRGDDSLMSLPQFAFYGLMISTLYIFVGGVTHSFPKYHYASVPILAVLAAGMFIKNIRIDRRLLAGTAILFLILVLYNVYFVKDLLYPINYALKEAVIIGRDASVSAIIRNEIFRTILLLLTIPAVFLFYARRSVREAFFIALFVTLLASNVSLLFIQRAADYNTVYCYGAKGVRETADFVLSNTDLSDTILAPPEILLLSRRGLASYGAAKNFGSKEEFLSTLQKAGLKCVIYGISGNTAEQYRKIFRRQDVMEFMNKYYLSHEIGSYTVWFKRK